MTGIADTEEYLQFVLDGDETFLKSPIRRYPILLPSILLPHFISLTTLELFEMADRYPSLEEFGEGNASSN